MGFWYLQIPFCVIVGWIMGMPMDLNFQLFETATLFITVLVVAFMLQVCSITNPSIGVCSTFTSEIIHFCYSVRDILYYCCLFSMQEGQSNYFKGLMLILCYLIVAASFFVHVDPTKG